MLVDGEKCLHQRWGGLCTVHESLEICLQWRYGGGTMAQRIQAPLNVGLCLIISREGISLERGDGGEEGKHRNRLKS